MNNEDRWATLTGKARQSRFERVCVMQWADFGRDHRLVEKSSIIQLVDVAGLRLGSEAAAIVPFFRQISDPDPARIR